MRVRGTASDILPVLRAGDLVLRDPGYFVIDSFLAIAARGAFFLTRHGIALLDGRGQPIALLARLRAEAHKPVVEIAVRAGAAGKLAERDKRLKRSADYEELLGWSIMLTNLPAGIGAERIVPLYGLRWRVEIVFKSWKSHLPLIALAMQCMFMPPLGLTDEIFLRQLDYHCRYGPRKRPNFVQKLRHSIFRALG